MGRARGLFGVLVGVGALGLGVSGALADTRYAAPGASGAQPCAQSAPCSLSTALTGTGSGGVKDGDTIVLAPGTYHQGSGLLVGHRVTIEGQPGAARPLIVGGAAFFLETGLPADLHDVRIIATDSSNGLVMEGGTAERVFVANESSGGAACLFYNATVRDSVCWALVAGGKAIVASLDASSQSAATTLRNVTAVGDAAGLAAQADNGAKIRFDIANTILSGATHDLVAGTDSSSGSSVTLALGHSAYATQATSGSGVVVTAPGTNGGVTAPPLFADPAGGDLHEAPGSPTIGAGDLSVLAPGELDFDLTPRSGPLICNGPARVDIGAFQTPAPTGCPPPPPPTSSPGPPPVVVKPVVVPVLRGLSFSHSRFAVTGAKRRRKGVAYGTTVHFTLSAAAKVTMTIWAKRHGHRHGKACVAAESKPTRCTQLFPIGAVKINGQEGTNQVTFSGHIARHALKPGPYKAKVVATIGSRHSHTLTHNFAIISG